MGDSSAPNMAEGTTVEAIVARAPASVAQAVLAANVKKAIEVLSECYAWLLTGRFDFADGDLGHVITGAARKLGETVSDAERERAEAHFAQLLHDLLWTPMAKGALIACNQKRGQALAIGARLSKTVSICQALSAYLNGKVERAASILSQLPDGTDEPLANTLDLLLVHAEARRYPKRHNELREKADASFPKANLLACVPPIILNDVVKLYLWLDRTGLDELVSGLSENSRSSISQPLLLAITERGRLIAAIRSGDARNIVESLAATESAKIPLPANECADLLLGFVGSPARASMDLVGALESHRGPRSPFLLTLSVLKLVQLARFSQAHDILLSALDDLFSSRRDDRFSEFYNRAGAVLSMFRFVAMELRRKAAPPLNLNEALERWTPLFLEMISSGALGRKERVCWLEIYSAMQSAYMDFADKARMYETIRSVLSVPGLKGDLKVLTIISALISSASNRPNPYVQKMDTELREAVEAAYPDLASFVRGLAENNDSLSSYTKAVVSLLDYYSRYDDILQFCVKARESSSAPDHQYMIAGLLLSRRNRRLMVIGAETIENLYSIGQHDDKYLSLLIEAKFKLGKSNEIPRFISSESDLINLDPVTAAQVGRLLEGYDLAHSILQRQLHDAAMQLAVSQKTKDLFKVYLCLAQINENQFLSEACKQLNSVTQPAKPKAAIVMLAAGVSELTRMPFLAFVELKKKGYAVLSAESPLILTQKTRIKSLNEIEGAIGSMSNVCRWARTDAEWFNDWDIDLPGRRAVCRGVEFFRGLEEALCCKFRRWTLDFNDPTVIRAALEYLAEMDFIIVWIDRLKEIAKETGIPILIFTSVTHSGNRFAARAYINAVSERGDVSLVVSCDSYESYYSNYESEFSTALALRNMTKYKTLAHACNTPVEEFEKWFESEWKSKSSKSAWTDQILHLGRIKKPGTPAAIQMRDRLMAARDSGTPIICLFGKILFDQGVPVRGGPAHSGMDDWVKHSLEVVAGRNDVLLLIKPHPHELREDIATYPSEMLQDWMPPDAPDNVIFLPHDMFNLYEVVEFIDLAVMWNGSSSIELGILEIPTVVCGLYGEIDYPVGHIVPRDRDHYRWLLTHPKEIVLPPDVPARSRALLEYRASVNVSTPYRYTRRSISNKKVTQYEWFSDDLKRYYSGGDEFVTLLADRIHNDLVALQQNIRA